jgi:hypothetical protein
MGIARHAMVAATLSVAVTANAQARTRADLVESRLGNPPARMAATRSFTITDVATNRGGARARQSVTRYYLRSGKTSVLAGARRVPALKHSGRSRGRVRLKVQAEAPGGRYSIVACVDATHRIREGNERNNCRVSRRRLAVAGPNSAGSSSTPTASSADGDHDGYPDSVDCAPSKASIHPGAGDKPDLDFIDSNCDGIDGDAAAAVFVSPTGNDASPGTLTRPLRTLAAAVAAADSRNRDVYASAGTYDEELDVVSRVGVYGGYSASWRRSLTSTTRITGAATTSGATEGAVALNVAATTTLQLLTLAPGAPIAPGASSYGLRGIHSPGLRIERVTVLAAPGAAGAAGENGTAGRFGGNAGNGNYPAFGVGGTSPVGHPGGRGATIDLDTGAGAQGSHGLFLVPDLWGRRGGDGGPGGKGGSDHSDGGRGYPGDPGIFLGDGTSGGPGNAMPGNGLWRGHDGGTGNRGSDGHGGGGGGGGGLDGCPCGADFAGQGGGGGGGGEGGGGGQGGHAGGGSFGIFVIASAGAVVRESSVTAANGGAGGAGGAGGLGGAGGAGGVGGLSPTDDGSDGGNGGPGGPGSPGGNGGGGAGGPSAAIVGLTPADAPGTTVRHGAGGVGGGGDVNAATGAAADYLVDGP